MNNIAKSNIRRKYRHMRLNPINYDRTPENMYLWGFLWADGYISKQKTRVSLEIITSDFQEISQLIPEHFGIYPRERVNRQPQTAIISTRLDYSNFLKGFGYYFKQYPPQFFTEHNNYHYWIRGLIDGDGCWYHRGCTRQFFIGSHYTQNWSYIENLYEQLEIRSNVKLTVQGKNKSSMIRTCDKLSLSRLFKFVYPCGYDGIGLTRKYDKAYQIYQSIIPSKSK